MTIMTWHLPAAETFTVDDIEDMPENIRAELHNEDLVIKPPGTV